MITRRTFGLSALGAAFGASAASPSRANTGSNDKSGEETFAVTKTPEQWKQQLTPMQYYVMREHGTERAGTSPLDKNYAAGTYLCAACDQALYASDHKFDSGTGWPSFFQPINDASVGTSTDKSWFMTRTEVHCSRCGGHLGHIFDDGPRPTGKRHCINGVALKFVPKASS